MLIDQFTADPTLWFDHWELLPPLARIPYRFEMTDAARPPDVDLVQGVSRGDRAALSILYRRYQGSSTGSRGK